MSHRRAGVSLVEILVGSVFAVVVLGAGVAVTKSSGDLATASSAEDGASRRTAAVVDAATDEIRHASLASIRRLDDTPFEDGASDAGFHVQRVVGFSGAATLAPAVTLRFDRIPGAAAGDLIRAEGPVEEIVARGVTSFVVTRTGDTFDVRVTVRSGHDGVLGRWSSGGVRLTTRNP